MDKETIKEYVESENSKGRTVLPTPEMKRWLRSRGLRIVVELGTGKAHIQY